MDVGRHFSAFDRRIVDRRLLDPHLASPGLRAGSGRRYRGAGGGAARRALGSPYLRPNPRGRSVRPRLRACPGSAVADGKHAPARRREAGRDRRRRRASVGPVHADAGNLSAGGGTGRPPIGGCAPDARRIRGRRQRLDRTPRRRLASGVHRPGFGARTVASRRFPGVGQDHGLAACRQSPHRTVARAVAKPTDRRANRRVVAALPRRPTGHHRTIRRSEPRPAPGTIDHSGTAGAANAAGRLQRMGGRGLGNLDRQADSRQRSPPGVRGSDLVVPGSDRHARVGSSRRDGSRVSVRHPRPQSPYRLGDEQYRQRFRGSVRRTDRPDQPRAPSRAQRAACIRDP